MHDSQLIDFASNDSKVDTSTYIPHSLWKLKNVDVNSVLSSDRYFDSDIVVSTEDISFSFLLKRGPLYFMINNIFPCMILNLVTLLAFSLPFSTQIGLSNTFLNRKIPANPATSSKD